MPILDIEDDFMLPLELDSVMHFPCDKNLRESYICHALCEIEIKNTPNENKIHTDSGTIRRLIESPSRTDMHNLSKQAFKDGWISGYILLTIYLMDFYNLDSEPSMRKAIYSLKELSFVEKYGDDSKIPRSSETIKNIWKKMRPVAHLWAAKELLENHPSSNFEGTFKSRENLILFLRQSATLLNFGTTFNPKRQNNSIIDLSESYQLPDEIMGNPYNLEMTLYPNRLKSFLKNYKAPKSNVYD